MENMLQTHKAPDTKMKYNISLMEYFEYLLSEHRFEIEIPYMHFYNEAFASRYWIVPENVEKLAEIEKIIAPTTAFSFGGHDKISAHRKDTMRPFEYYFPDVAIAGLTWTEMLENWVNEKKPDILGLMTKTQFIPKDLAKIMLEILQETAKEEKGVIGIEQITDYVFGTLRTEHGYHITQDIPDDVEQELTIDD